VGRNWNIGDTRFVWYRMMFSALSPFPSALAGVLVAASLGCDVTIKDGDVSFNQLHGRATREWARKYPLAAGGRVEVTNINGPIEVSAGPAGEVEASAVITARAMTNERARELLAEATIEEIISAEHVKLTSVRGAGRGGLGVNYKLTVPADARVELICNNGDVTTDSLRGHIKSIVVNGSVQLTGVRGSVDAAFVNGSMSAKVAEVTGRIRLEGTNGRIALEVPKDTKATLNARSVNGGITVTGLTTQEASGRRIRSVESVLNGGGPEIEVRITNGRITIEGK
jgi:hypothetical protein